MSLLLLVTTTTTTITTTTTTLPTDCVMYYSIIYFTCIHISFRRLLHDEMLTARRANADLQLDAKRYKLEADKMALELNKRGNK